jgi:hypothetical protein
MFYMFFFILVSFTPLCASASQSILEGYFAYVTEKQSDDTPVKALKKGISKLKKCSFNTQRLYTGYHTLNHRNDDQTYSIVLRAPLLFHALLLYNNTKEKMNAKKQHKKLKIITFLCEHQKANINQELILYWQNHRSLINPILFACQTEVNQKIIAYFLESTDQEKLHNLFSFMLQSQQYDLAKILYKYDLKNQNLYRIITTQYLYTLQGSYLIEAAYAILILNQIPFDSQIKDSEKQNLIVRLLFCNPHQGTESTAAKQEQIFHAIKKFFNIKHPITIKRNDSFEERNLLDIASNSHCSMPIISTLSLSGLTLTPERLSHSFGPD